MGGQVGVWDGPWSWNDFKGGCRSPWADPHRPPGFGDRQHKPRQQLAVLLTSGRSTTQCIQLRYSRPRKQKEGSKMVSSDLGGGRGGRRSPDKVMMILTLKYMPQGQLPNWTLQHSEDSEG
eukprot:EG_transcript_39971